MADTSGSDQPPQTIPDEVAGLPAAQPTNVANEDPNLDQLEDELIAEVEPTKTEERSGLRKLLSSAIGTDLTSMAVPVTYNEPLSFLQRMCEYLQYKDLLSKANACDDPHIRMLFVTVFAITCYAGTDRKVKPFNPLLGETFEYVDESNGFYFHSEQVSHHPPIGASHAETSDWSFYQTQSVKTKFLGNSLDVTPIGVSHVILKKHNEHYSWPNIRTLVHNLIIGRMWVDHYGPCPVTVVNNETNELIPIKGDMKFKECGWFGRGWHEIEGNILGEGNQAYFELSGKWTEQVSATGTAKGRALADPNSGLSFASGKPVQVWKLTNGITKVPKFAKHDWTDVTVGLVLLDDEIKKQIPLTDARLREDRHWLQEGEIKKASTAKHQLEEAQRARKRWRDANGIASWTPRYFKLATDSNGTVIKNSLGDDQWISKGNYWEERKKRIADRQTNGKMAVLEDACKMWRLQKDWA